MFTRPPYLPLLVGIWLVPLIVGIVAGPYGWSFFLPKPVEAVLRFSETRYFNRNRDCASESPGLWRTIAANPDAAGWFRTLAREGKYPAGRLYGMVGLYAVDRVTFNREQALLGHTEVPSTVAVTTDEGSQAELMRDLLQPAVLDTIVGAFRDSTVRPDC